MRKHFLLYINNSTTNKMSKNLLTVVHIFIHNGGNNGDIHRSMKYLLNSKLQNLSEKYENIKSAYLKQI